MNCPNELRSVGIHQFIILLEDVPHKSRTEIEEYCIKNNISNEGGAGRRASNFITIMKDKNKLINSLNYIIHESKRVAYEDKMKAKQLVEKINIAN